MAKTVGEVLRLMREEASLSRSALARQLKLEPGALLRIETGASPSFEAVAKVARGLGLSLDAIAEAAYGKGPRPAADLSGPKLATALERLERLLGESLKVVEAARAGRSVSPPRGRAPQRRPR